jgi:uncharacterized protein (TIGR03067 family)
MFLTKLKFALAVLVTIGIAGLMTAALTRTATAGAPALPTNAPTGQPTAGAGEQARSDRQKLLGAWIVVAVTEDGNEIPEGDVKSRGGEIVFAGDKITVRLSDRTKEFTYQLDAAHNPHQIDMVHGGLTSKGIYLLDKGTLKLCVAKDGGERPGEFAAPSATNRVLMLLKKRP